MFYDNLKSLCDSRGLKITNVVTECGGALGSVNGWKNGAMPNSGIVVALALRLNVTTDYLLLGKGNCNVSNIGTGGTFSSNGTVNIGNNIYPKQDNDDLSSNDELSKEIAKILKELPLRERTKLLNLIYEFEENYNNKT